MHEIFPSTNQKHWNVVLLVRRQEDSKGGIHFRDTLCAVALFVRGEKPRACTQKTETDERMEKEALRVERYGKEERVPHERNENEATILYPLLYCLYLSLSTTVSTTFLCLSNARTLQEKRNIDQDGDIKVERRCTTRITCATFSS